MATGGQPAHDGAGRLLHRHQTRHGKIIFRGERRLHETRTDQGHPYAPGREIEAQGGGQIVEGRLGGAIGLGPWQR